MGGFDRGGIPGQRAGEEWRLIFFSD